MEKRILTLAAGIIIGMVLSGLIFKNAKDTLHNHYEELENYILDPEETEKYYSDPDYSSDFSKHSIIDFEDRISIEKSSELAISNMVYFDGINELSFGIIYDEDVFDYSTDVYINGISYDVLTIGNSEYYTFKYIRMFVADYVLQANDEIVVKIYNELDDLEQVDYEKVYIYKGN